MRQSEKKKRNIIIGSLLGIMLLMVVGYAAFSSVLNIKGTSTIASNWNILITNVTAKNIVGGASVASEPTWDGLTATFKTNLVSPGDSIEYDITVENRGNLNATLDKITLTDSNNPAIKFTSSGLTEGDSLNAGSNAVLTVKVEYDNNVTSQPENTTGTLTVTLDYTQEETNVIPPPEPITPSDLIAKEVTTGDGLYSDDYERGRYIYKGTNPDNYITFNDETWRILSVESDGGLKIMKAESIGNIAWDSSNSNDWTRPATLNTYLNTEYYNSLSSEARSLIQIHTWNIGSVTSLNTDLAAQIASENKTTWTGNIGLMNASEFIRSNSNTEKCGNYSLNYTNRTTCKTTNYIVPTSGNLWTISPLTDYTNFVIDVSSGGYVSSNRAYATDESVLPALYLTPNITLYGEGTMDNPYTINS